MLYQKHRIRENMTSNYYVNNFRSNTLYDLGAMLMPHSSFLSFLWYSTYKIIKINQIVNFYSPMTFFCQIRQKLFLSQFSSTALIYVEQYQTKKCQLVAQNNKFHINFGPIFLSKHKNLHCYILFLSKFHATKTVE